jgi:ketosteroid isomerase-like protein
VTIRPEEFFDLDPRMLVFLLVQLRPVDSKAAVEMRVAHLWTMRDGMPARCEVFTDRAEAARVAGLSE